MKEEVAKKWVAELRSGKHEQGRGLLLDANGCKCCLGVLVYDVLEMKASPDSAALSSSQMEASGIETALGSLRNIGVYTTLSAMNDGGRSFASIAEVIEKNWRDL